MTFFFILSTLSFTNSFSNNSFIYLEKFCEGKLEYLRSGVGLICIGTALAIGSSIYLYKKYK